MNRMMYGLAGVLSACALVFSGRAWAAGYELSATSMMMTTHPVVAGAVLPLFDELEKRTGGQLKIAMYNAGTLVPDAELYSSAQRGVVDMAFFFVSRTPHLFPILSIGDYPFLFTNSRAASFSLMAMVENNEQLRKEMGQVKFLSFTASAPKDLVSLKPIRTLEDLQGKRVGVLDAASSEMIALLGGTAILLPLPDMYMGLQRGMVDAVLAPIPTYRSTKVCEVGKYITRVSMANSVTPLVMNKAAYERLPADIRGEIDKVTGFPFSSLLCNWVEKSTQEDLQYVIEHDKVQLIDLPAQERARWEAKVQPVFTAWIANARKAGVQDPEGILAQLREYAAYYNQNENQRKETEKYKDVLGSMYLLF